MAIRELPPWGQASLRSFCEARGPRDCSSLVAVVSPCVSGLTTRPRPKQAPRLSPMEEAYAARTPVLGWSCGVLRALRTCGDRRRARWTPTTTTALLEPPQPHERGAPK